MSSLTLTIYNYEYILNCDCFWKINHVYNCTMPKRKPSLCPNNNVTIGMICPNNATQWLNNYSEMLVQLQTMSQQSLHVVSKIVQQWLNYASIKPKQYSNATSIVPIWYSSNPITMTIMPWKNDTTIIETLTKQWPNSLITDPNKNANPNKNTNPNGDH